MNTAFEPAYLRLHRSGELQHRVEQARRHLENCDLCAYDCRINWRETIRVRCVGPAKKRWCTVSGAPGGRRPLTGAQRFRDDLLQRVQSALRVLPLNRCITLPEYQRARVLAGKYGLHRLDQRRRGWM